MLSFSQIISIVEPITYQLQVDVKLTTLLLDSRKVFVPKESLFFAIKGNRHDGHVYLRDLYDKGVRNFVVEKNDAIQHFADANYVVVQSATAALQAIAANHRNQYHYPVVAVTGSNGKTIVKEWLAQLCTPDYKVIKSPKSFNSQVGVPLSVWYMSDWYNLAIIEAGISKVGEMQNLQKVIRPTIGIFTNIGTAHAEGFASIQQKTEEKLQLFKDAEVIIFCSDSVEIATAVNTHLPSKKQLSWTLKENKADINVKIIGKDSRNTLVTIDTDINQFNVAIPFTDYASVENALQCIACMLYLEIATEDIIQRVKQLHPVAMRLELKKGINNNYLIDDTYNNDLAGLSMALDFLEQQQQVAHKTVILSDMLESAMSSETLYTQVASLLQAKHIYRLIGIGKEISRYQNLFENGLFFETTTDFLKEFSNIKFQSEAILIKGARVFAFEQIVHALQEKVHGTVLSVNLDALVHNLNFYKSQLLPETKIMVMVKAFAYGSGSYEVANLLQHQRVDYLGVAFADEGIDLRKHGIQLPIMVMNPTADALDMIVKNRLEPEIYSFELLEQLLHYLQVHPNAKANIHIKLDTGMHRLGFEWSDVEQLIAKIQSCLQIRVVSIFSHLAAADSKVHEDFTLKQLTTFAAIADSIEQAIGYTTIKHILNSAGIINYTAHQHQMIRLGIGLYGVEASNNMQPHLQFVGTLKTVISQIKQVPAGETIGYGRLGVATSDTTIATIAIGYADGYDRRFGKGIGKIMVNGVQCPVIGNVCMDMTMIDISQTQAVVGDEVEIFGQNIPISTLAEQIGTIPYEILTNVSGRVKRVFFAT